VENLLSYGPAEKGSQLTSEMFYKDESGKFDRANPLHEDVNMKNKGLAKRPFFFAQRREVHLVGRLHTDIFFQRYTLNEVNTKLKLTRSKDITFCLMAVGDQAFRLRISSAAMLKNQNQFFRIYN